MQVKELSSWQENETVQFGWNFRQSCMSGEGYSSLGRVGLIGTKGSMLFVLPMMLVTVLLL